MDFCFLRKTLTNTERVCFIYATAQSKSSFFFKVGLGLLKQKNTIEKKEERG